MEVKIATCLDLIRLTLDFSRGGAQHFTSRRRLQIFVMQLRQELD